MSKKDRGQPIAGHPNIKKKNNGKFFVDYNPTNPYTGARSYRKTKTVDSLLEAKQVLKQFKSEFSEAVGYFETGSDEPHPKEITLGYVAELRLAKSKRCRSYSDIERNIGYVLEILGENRPVLSINERTVSWFIDQAFKRRSKLAPFRLLSNKSVWGLLQQLMSLLRLAHKKAWIKSVPEYSFQKNFGVRKITVNLETYLMMLESLPSAPYPDRAMALMGLFTGQRLKDLRFMSKEQVEGRQIRYKSSKTNRDDMVLGEAPDELLFELNALNNGLCPVSLEEYLEAICVHSEFPTAKKALLLTALATGLHHPQLNQMRWQHFDIELKTLTFQNKCYQLPQSLILEFKKLRPVGNGLVFVNDRGKLWCKNSICQWSRQACKKADIVPLTPGEMRRLAVNKNDPLAPIWANGQKRENDNFIFIHPKTGAPLAPNTVRRHIKIACDKAGIPYHTPHQWRHLAATEGLDATNDPDLVQRWIGWLDPKMIKRYGKAGDRTGRMIRSLEEKISRTRESIHGEDEPLAEIIPFDPQNWRHQAKRVRPS